MNTILLLIVPDVFLKTVVLLVVFIHTIVSCIWLQFLVKPQLYFFLVRSSASNLMLLIIAVEVHFFLCQPFSTKSWGMSLSLKCFDVWPISCTDHHKWLKECHLGDAWAWDLKLRYVQSNYPFLLLVEHLQQSVP